MCDILKSNIDLSSKNFWYNIGVTIQKRVKGIVQVLFCENENSIIIKIFFEKINYNVSFKFHLNCLYERTTVLNNICDGLRYDIYEKVFK